MIRSADMCGGKNDGQLLVIQSYLISNQLIFSLEFEERYSKTMFAIQEAADFGKSGSECATAYKW